MVLSLVDNTNRQNRMSELSHRIFRFNRKGIHLEPIKRFLLTLAPSVFFFKYNLKLKLVLDLKIFSNERVLIFSLFFNIC